MNVLICDPISPKGIQFFKDQPDLNVTVLDKRLKEEELLPIVGDVHAMVVRSETKVTQKVIEAAKNLQVIGRAGVGVDNVDVETATGRGIVVMNTPSGNTISTAELTFSMLMALARRIPQAHASMKNGEWNRKAFKGIELYGKTLGVLGMGRIGGEVAKRAIAFGMKVVAYDPYLSHGRAKALLEAVESGQVAGAALDVYEKEPLAEDSPLRKCPQIIMTPHLGASTEEAQDNVGIEVAETITDYLLNRVVCNAVNLPNIDAKTYEQVKPYLNLGEKLGRLLGQIAPKRNDRLVLTYGGKAKDIPGDPVTRSVLKGFLETAGGKEVNQVNVRTMAETLGLLVEEVKSSEETDFNEWLHVAVWSDDQKNSAGGTFFGAQNNPRIVRINSQPVEIVPEGVLLLLYNKDRPGIVGHIGSLIGKHDVNIANMSLSREIQGGQALTVLNLDSVPPKALLDEIQEDPDISNVRVAQL